MYWIGLPFLSLGHLPDPGIEVMSVVSPALAGGFFTTVSLGEPEKIDYGNINRLLKTVIYS